VILEGPSGLGIAKGGKKLESFGHIIEEALEALNGLQAWKVNHIRQHLNSAAHGLAKKTLSLSL
jgi:hypothetical protein